MYAAALRGVGSLPLAVGGSFGLLVLLGTLQYRWVGQISEAERTQLRSATRARAEAFARDFDREVTRALLGLVVDPETMLDRDLDRYAARYDNWRRRARYPELVDAVFLVERGGEQDPPRVSRFDPQRRSFVPGTLPTGLSALEARLAQLAAEIGPREERWQGPKPDRSRRRFETTFRPGFGDLLSGEPPALALPILVPPARPESGSPWRGIRLAGWSVVVLDLDHIKEEVLPSLAARHFGGDGPVGYRLAVMKQDDPRQVVWQSDPGGAPAATGDAAAGLMELRFEDVDEDAATRMVWHPTPEGPRAHPDGASAPGRLFGLAGRRVARAHGPDSGLWRLAATHGAGSIDHVVAAARRRNLGVSFGVLGLLGASTALVLVSAQRARRLAGRQMEFVAGVSHELRTPAAVICSAAENLADGVVSEPDQVRRYGEMLRDEGRKLAEMVEGVLEFAGTYSGRRLYRSEPVDVATLIEEAIAPVAEDLGRCGFTVIRELAPDLPAVRGDAGALRRTLQNLVANALKHGADGRWLRVRADSGAGDGPAAVRITVEDRGPGIAAEELASVFEPFFRGRDASARSRGFGLGLTLVKRVVEAHGGRVEVESSAGKTAFTLLLPAAPAAAGAAQPAHGLADPAR